MARGYNNYAFSEVTDGDAIHLRRIPTILTPKKYFFPQEETLLEYNTSRGLSAQAIVEYERMVLFGVHTCDLAGIQCLNMVFSRMPKHYNYLILNNKIEIIGIECNEYCDECANCTLVNANLPSGGYDLFFTDTGEHFIVHINTQSGDELVEAVKVFEPAECHHLQELVKLREQKRTIFRN